MPVSRPILLTMSLLVLVATTGANGLNLWLDRSTLSQVFDWMQFLSSRRPLRASRCKPRQSTELHNALIQSAYHLVLNDTALAHPPLDFLSPRGIALSHNLNFLRFNWTAASGVYGESRVQYRLLRVKSHNTTVLDTPILSIASRGFVPTARDSSFLIELHCTGIVSGLTGFEMHMAFEWPMLPNRRMVLVQRHFKKACLSTSDLRRHMLKCHCRADCRDQTKANNRRTRRQLQSRRRRRCQKRCQRRCRRMPRSCGVFAD